MNDVKWILFQLYSDVTQGENKYEESQIQLYINKRLQNID